MRGQSHRARSRSRGGSPIIRIDFRKPEALAESAQALATRIFTGLHVLVAVGAYNCASYKSDRVCRTFVTTNYQKFELPLRPT